MRRVLPWAVAALGPALVVAVLGAPVLAGAGGRALGRRSGRRSAAG